MIIPLITKTLDLRLAFCFILLTLAWTSGPKNYGESNVNDKNAKSDSSSSFNTYSSSLDPAITIQNLDTSDGTDGNVSSEVDRAVIIMFDRAYDTQFTNAKPILDKYGFKVSFFVICSFVEGAGYHKLSNGSELRSKGTNAMTWDHIRQLYEEGHDLQSHRLEHKV